MQLLNILYLADKFWKANVLCGDVAGDPSSCIQYSHLHCSIHHTIHRQPRSIPQDHVQAQAEGGV